MRVGSFSLLIPEGRELDSNHVVLAHGAVYRIHLGNHHGRRCDATVEVDGKEVGTWRIGPGQSIVLERPVHDTGRFTFFESRSGEAQAAGVGAVEVASRGLIRATFRPERVYRPLPRVGSLRAVAGGPSCGMEAEEKTAGLVPGITGLTGTSGQHFKDVAPLDYDPLLEVTIYLRLVSGLPEVRPLTVSPRSNSVPAPAE